MSEWIISDMEIELIEKLLLPDNAHFQDDAKDVIRCWHSTDVSACPGSGKTTVLLAKLKLLADRMPLENGAGICVLSHTNVAVDEIKKRLKDYSDKLLNYPNFIGTIQSFVDRFVTMPYLKMQTGKNIQVVDDETYAKCMLNKFNKKDNYSTLNWLIKKRLKGNVRFKNELDCLKALFLDENGNLYVENQQKAIAKSSSDSAIQYNKLIQDLQENERIIRYKDAYTYVGKAIKELNEKYINLFSLRFQYVFIDEYQDCNEIQRKVIDFLFDKTKCVVFKIGDPDQAIYNSNKESTKDWVPQKGFLTITNSYRYNQKIANVISKLKTDEETINALTNTNITKPVLIVFPIDKIDKVIGTFISVLDNHNIVNKDGIYKAIGAVKNKDSQGLKIGSYWQEFDSSTKKKIKYNYWVLVDEIVIYLSKGKLYKAERVVRSILCYVFYYILIGKNYRLEKVYTITTMKKGLDENYRNQYHQWIYEMSKMQNINRYSVDQLLRNKINEFLNITNPLLSDIFERLPDYFLDKTVTCNYGRNILIESIGERKIIFDTIHGVKGETHDATLYLETENGNSSDLKRIIKLIKGQNTESNLYDYSRKLAYVGMSRPKTLLCVAMQESTFNASGTIFDNDWEIVDLREKNNN